MRHGCARAVHVQLEDRHFIVEYNSDDDVLRIKERNHGPGLSGTYNASYWVASSHVLGSGDTLPKRILRIAKEKHAV